MRSPSRQRYCPVVITKAEHISSPDRSVVVVDDWKAWRCRDCFPLLQGNPNWPRVPHDDACIDVFQCSKVARGGWDWPSVAQQRIAQG